MNNTALLKPMPMCTVILCEFRCALICARKSHFSPAFEGRIPKFDFTSMVGVMLIARYLASFDLFFKFSLRDLFVYY